MKKRDWKIALISVGITLGVVVLIAFILHLFSFEIVYDAKVITNWDAVAGCAAWVGVLVSVAALVASIFAIVYAISVPEKIAQQQNKIALFEKRYEICQVYSKCVSFYKAVEKSKNTEGLHDACKFIFDDRDIDKIDRNYFLMKSTDFERTIHQTAMLFPKVDEHDVGLVYTSLFDFLVAIVENKDIQKTKYTYMTTFYDFNIKYGRIFWEETRISNL